MTKYLLLALLVAVPVQAQDAAEPQPSRKSGKKAFALSLLLPGLGHRYAHGGSWAGSATVFALADASLWASLVGTTWRRDDLVQSYTTLAASRADAKVAGKDRTFFLNLASFHSSDEFREVMLRNRAWDQIDYVSDRAFHWAWASEEDFQAFRALRDDAESMRRRRGVVVSLLVANRLLAGLTALRATGRANARLPEVSLSLAPAADLPLVNLTMRF